jgi:hypothetical protein
MVFSESACFWRSRLFLADLQLDGIFKLAEIWLFFGLFYPLPGL